MNSPKMPVLNELNNGKPRGDFSGQLTEGANNEDEIRAIEADPTLFPNSTRIYVEGEIHKGLRVPMREIRVSDTEHPNGRDRKKRTGTSL